jgi:putative transposase
VRPKRGPQSRAGDLELAANIRRLVDARATYGYRRIAALLKRERRADGMAPVNAKRVYRLMKRHGLLLARHTGRRRPREHDGQVATLRSNIRWCSDGLEFTCWNGEIVRVAFALDCHDREVIGWVATTAGISGEMIRDMMVRCVEQRFGDIRAAASGAMAVRQRLNLRRPQDHRDRRGAQLGAVLHPGRKRDYVRVSPIPDANTALVLIDSWMEDYNTVHPHSRLGYRSPREYILSQPVACPV